MLYEYPDEFIVPINYVNTLDYNVGIFERKNDKCTIETQIKSITSDEKTKIIKEHKLKKYFRDCEDSKNMLVDFVDMDIMSESYKDYYLENTNMYSDIDDEYANNEITKK